MAPQVVAVVVVVDGSVVAVVAVVVADTYVVPSSSTNSSSNGMRGIEEGKQAHEYLPGMRRVNHNHYTLPPPSGIVEIPWVGCSIREEGE